MFFHIRQHCVLSGRQKKESPQFEPQAFLPENKFYKLHFPEYPYIMFTLTGNHKKPLISGILLYSDEILQGSFGNPKP
jgi:hypothetical protein